MKKNTKIIILISSVVIITMLGALFREYYKDRYVETEVVYVKVPVNQSLEIEDIKDSDGNMVDQGRNYVFEGYTEEGGVRIVEFSYSTEDPKELLQPKEYVRLSVSNDLVLSEKVVPESEVPSHVIQFLNK